METCRIRAGGFGFEITAGAGAVTRVQFLPEGAPLLPPGTLLLRQAARELEEYFAGKRKTFDVPVAHGKAGFTGRALDALRRVPWGAVVTYGALAQAAGNPRAARAAGRACHDNPVPIFIPCHRVLGANGGLTGFASGLDHKRALLLLEGTGVLEEITAK